MVDGGRGRLERISGFWYIPSHRPHRHPKRFFTTRLEYQAQATKFTKNSSRQEENVAAFSFGSTRAKNPATGYWSYTQSIVEGASTHSF